MNEISLWKEYSFLIISCSYNMSFFSENCVSYKKDPQFSSGIMGTRQTVPSSSIGTGILCCDSVPAGMKKISARLPFSFILICNFLKGRQIPIRKLFKEYFWKNGYFLLQQNSPDLWGLLSVISLIFSFSQQP